MGGIADGNFPALDAAAEALFEPWRWDAAADGEIGQARLFGMRSGRCDLNANDGHAPRCFACCASMKRCASMQSPARFYASCCSHRHLLVVFIGIRHAVGRVVIIFVVRCVANNGGSYLRLGGCRFGWFVVDLGHSLRGRGCELQ